MSEINRQHIDPVRAMSVQQLLVIYGRKKTRPPKQNAREDDEQYKARLVQVQHVTHRVWHQLP